ncbi:Phosphoribosylaminoimidazole carboxylase (NCAIR synthetase) (PurK) [Fructobacillus tropaeoli]|uniref:5-(carboxyamino)imidazole ribonucleotide synthase n=1 Tax=Fructobacillus tropaeoli TaxID=709323 RepID=UPI002DB46D41|nr:Phosphoribosylaminoimidazole carboxylase (NCAIR synthetase) (PurK) [Fructobacillus tropaeoli]
MTEANRYLEPGKTIGIIGGGQLGQMMALSAKEMGYKVIVLDPTPACPTAQVCDDQIVAEYDDQKALQELADRSDVLTYEFENVSQEALKDLKDAYVPQGVRLLEITSNRLAEKAFIRDEAQVPVAKFARVENPADLDQAVTEVGLPGILKTVSGGYDGHGQFDLNTAADVEKLKANWPGGVLILEQKIAFTREISVMVTRTKQGQLVTWPISENVHQNHILKTCMIPAAITKDLDSQVHEIAKTIADKLDLRGVLGIELFVDQDSNQVWVNELAPRPHNSGHYTIEACNISQFEGHIRSIVGLPIPEIKLHDRAMMVNLLGDELLKARQAFPDHADWHFHDYGKAAVKPGRKMGHLTVVGQPAIEDLSTYFQTI